MSDIETLIQNIANGNFNQAGEDFNNIMNSKITDSLDQEKIAVAGQMFGEKELDHDLEDDEDFDLEDIDLDDIDLEDIDLED